VVSPRERARRLVDGELDATEEAALRADAARDETLAAALDEAESARRLLAELEPEGPPAPPADLVDRAILRAVQRRATAEDAPTWRRWLRRLTRPVVVRLRLTPTSLLVGATAVALLGVYGLRTARPATSATAPEQPAATQPPAGSPANPSSHSHCPLAASQLAFSPQTCGAHGPRCPN